LSVVATCLVPRRATKNTTPRTRSATAPVIQIVSDNPSASLAVSIAAEGVGEALGAGEEVGGAVAVFGATVRVTDPVDAAEDRMLEDEAALATSVTVKNSVTQVKAVVAKRHAA
jgi:hypothetical protein